MKALFFAVLILPVLAFSKQLEPFQVEVQSRSESLTRC